MHILYICEYIYSFHITDVDYIEFFQENKNPSGREVFVFPVGSASKKTLPTNRLQKA